ncbi:50S ribosomal protein L11 methyltransferase [Pseudomonas sp. F1_0610]|uniref:class I SAM-dependent methyltransferase n=1 Tax=Pseudomonas sp. F1_0610 TaxID=3114284 RepID=UPI0039C407DB
MLSPTLLIKHLQHFISDAQLSITPLNTTPIQLWLIDPNNMQRHFTAEETQALLNAPPYWCFCWASGFALAKWLLQHSEQVNDKTIIDFGAGSGVVAIAAALAGAKKVIACDLDPIALQACQANAYLNQVELSYCPDLLQIEEKADLLIAADILYDSANFSLLEQFPHYANDCLIADSRVRNFEHAQYQTQELLTACTLPDLQEPEEFKNVRLYRLKSDKK